MEREELVLGLGELAVRISEGWHEVIEIDALDIMLLNEAAEALAQPAQEPIGFAGVKIWVGNQQVVKLLTRIELDHAIDPWLHVKLNADMCIATLLKRMSK